MFDALRARLLAPRARLGLHLIFDGLVLITHLARGRTPDRSASELRGFRGAIVYELTGAGGGTWHFLVSEGLAWFKRGDHPTPIARVTLSADEFFKLLSGNTSFMVSQMTGTVRIHGDGHAGMVLGSLVGSLLAERGRDDGRGRFTRAWMDLALATSGTAYRCREGEK